MTYQIDSLKRNISKASKLHDQYQIKEIYWKQDSQSSTKNIRRRFFDEITQMKAEETYITNSGKNLNTKNVLAQSLKKVMDDEQFLKFNKACNRRDDDKIKRLMEKLQLHYKAKDIWSYFQTFRIEKKKIVNWEDKNNLVKTHRRLYENRVRLANKLKNITKKVRNKFRGCKLKNDICYMDQEGIVRLSEEQWEEEMNKLAYRALDSHDRCKLNQLINIRLERNSANKAQENICER
jgi:hypothetical protein